jgi:hypothetical protein
MKFRLTPLNLFSAFFLFLAIYVWIYGAPTVGVHVQQLGTTLGWIFMLFAFVVSFLDIMLRNFFPETKKIWIVELSFITLTIIIFLIVK